MNQKCQKLFQSLMNFTAPYELLLIYYFKATLINQIQMFQGKYLHLRTVTWEKDSHSLFDYQTKQRLKESTFDFSLTAPEKFIFIFRQPSLSMVSMVSSLKMIPPDSQKLQLLGCLQIKTLENKKYMIQFHHAAQLNEIRKECQTMSQQYDEINQIKNKAEEDIFLIIRSLKHKNNQSKGYKLNVGQNLKFGRVKFKVSAIKTATKHEQSTNFNMLFNNSLVKDCSNMMIDQQSICRYCYLDESQGNILIAPCKCMGGVQFIHFDCLEKWIQSKVKKQIIGGTLHYNFQEYHCQICKHQFPRFIKINQKMHQLLKIQQPEGDYLIVEEQKQKGKNVLVVQNISEAGIKLGRSQQCQIRIPDISVSRNHASLQRRGQDFYLFDNKSKFGTLVKDEQMLFEVSKIKQAVQIGRTVLTFQLGKSEYHIDTQQ